MSDTWNPSQYEKFKSERSQPYFDLLDLVVAKPDMDIIDLGCGTGELTKSLHLRLHAHRTLGVDNSAAMLEKCRGNSAEGLSFARQDIGAFQEGTAYDLIFANASVQWCSNHRDLFRQFRAGLKADGQLAIQMPMNHDYPTHTIASQLADEWQEKGLMASGARQPTLLTPEEYAQLLFDLKFVRQQVVLKVYAHVLEHRDAVIEWVRGTLLTYYQSRLTPELFARFEIEYKNRLFKVLPDAKPFFYPFKRIHIWGSLA